MSGSQMYIELMVECPHCNDSFDLFDIDGLNNNGYLTNSACPDGNWNEAHKDFKITVKCPECEKEIKVNGILW